MGRARSGISSSSSFGSYARVLRWEESGARDYSSFPFWRWVSVDFVRVGAFSTSSSNSCTCIFTRTVYTDQRVLDFRTDYSTLENRRPLFKILFANNWRRPSCYHQHGYEVNRRHYVLSEPANILMDINEESTYFNSYVMQLSRPPVCEQAQCFTLCTHVVTSLLVYYLQCIDAITVWL